MRKNLFYIILLLCISFLTMHDDRSVSCVAADNKEISFNISGYTLSEYTHEQSACRPTSISVPSVVRTASSGRQTFNPWGTGQAGLKSENQLSSWLETIKFLKTPLSSAGFSDSRSFLLSLCRLII